MTREQAIDAIKEALEQSAFNGFNVQKNKDALAALDTLSAAQVPLDPSPSMIDAGAQRLVSFEENSVWPDSWDKLQVAAAKNEAERVWRSMYLAAMQGEFIPMPRGGMIYDWNDIALSYQRQLRKLKKLICAEGYTVNSDKDDMPYSVTNAEPQVSGDVKSADVDELFDLIDMIITGGGDTPQDDYAMARQELRDFVAKERSACDKMREALEFYANGNVKCFLGSPIEGLQTTKPHMDMGIPCGTKAKQALAAQPEVGK